MCKDTYFAINFIINAVKPPNSLMVHLINENNQVGRRTAVIPQILSSLIASNCEDFSYRAIRNTAVIFGSNPTDVGFP